MNTLLDLLQLKTKRLYDLHFTASPFQLFVMTGNKEVSSSKLVMYVNYCYSSFDFVMLSNVKNGDIIKANT